MKVRKAELHKFCVKWIDGDSIFFRWFKRDKQAMQFQQELIDDGIPMYNIRVTMK